jgi:hypothetical protein
MFRVWESFQPRSNRTFPVVILSSSPARIAPAD